MLAKAYTDEVVVEPPSFEDIEARVDGSADDASSGVRASGAQLEQKVSGRIQRSGSRVRFTLLVRYSDYLGPPGRTT
jgi:hypothetical protein